MVMDIDINMSIGVNVDVPVHIDIFVHIDISVHVLVVFLELFLFTLIFLFAMAPVGRRLVPKKITSRETVLITDVRLWFMTDLFVSY